MADEITMLRGEGRRMGPFTGIYGELLSEFFGTFILIMFGVGVVAQVVLSGRTAGDYLSINIGWGLGVTMGVYAAAGVSGAHLNPAVTVSIWSIPRAVLVISTRRKSGLLWES